MSKLTKNNKYAILWLNHEGLSKEKIASELKLDLQQITRVLKSQNNTINNLPETEQQTTNKPKSSKDFMITKTSEKGSNTVAIMTKTASEINDEARKLNQNQISNMDRPGIFRPNNG